MASAFLDALPLLGEKLSFQGLILTGPNMSDAEREMLRQRASSHPVDVLTSSREARAWVCRASLIVTMAGYNSLSEVLALRKKALVVPRSGPSREQRIRSQFFSERGLVHMLDPDRLTADRLTGELLRLHANNSIPDPDRIPPLDGAQQAARVMLEQTVQRSRHSGRSARQRWAVRGPRWS